MALRINILYSSLFLSKKLYIFLITVAVAAVIFTTFLVTVALLLHHHLIFLLCSLKIIYTLETQIFKNITHKNA
jgi:hypothetical protein